MHQGILETLRSATRAHHRQMERNPRLARLLKKEFSLNEYRVLLERLYGFYRPLEEKITVHREWAAFPICYAERLKTALLERDLQVLGVMNGAFGAVPRCSDLPDVRLFPRALGCVYVLEGATLGGRIIASHLKKSLGLSEVWGSAFYAAYGDRVNSMWHGFCGSLVAYAATHELDIGAMTAAACDTFQKLDSWLVE